MSTVLSEVWVGFGFFFLPFFKLLHFSQELTKKNTTFFFSPLKTSNLKLKIPAI